MKKTLCALFLTLSVLAVNRSVSAVTLVPNQIKQIIDFGKFQLVVSPTPTTAPSLTPAPTATLTPPPPTYTVTPAPTITEQEMTPSIASSSSSQSSEKTQPVISPVTKNQTGFMTIKEILLSAGVFLLLVIVMVQSWPKIKTWLHDKTK